MSRQSFLPLDAVAHLQPAVWDAVNRRLVAKAIGEFAHERLIEPRPVQVEGAWGWYELGTDQSDVAYGFRARETYLDHWVVDPKSIEKLPRGSGSPIDALAFIVELRQMLAIPPAMLPEYLQELTTTLYGAAYKHVHASLDAEQLALASFQEVETGMTEGHPIFVANNGRIGFDALDYPRYTPEAAEPIRLVWLAVRRDRADVANVANVSFAELVTKELGAPTCERFGAVLRDRGFEPEQYVVLPVHPWQWVNRIAQLFAGDLASGDLVYLGEGHDAYLAQQSIRTLYNIDHPHKHYVKTSLSILNMGFTRGMSASIARRVAAVNDWIGALVGADPYLSELGFGVLREVAFVGVRHRHYEAAISRRIDTYKEMLAALWRESPAARLAPGQRLMTMAALLHIDRDGEALLATLVRASGLDPEAWFRRYLEHYLKPILHCFYAHRVTFTPHCENTILILEGDAVVGMLLKDLGEDIGVLNPEVELPESVRCLALRVPEDVMTLAIFTDVFDCVFRLLAPLAQDHLGFPESRFWDLVAECITDYQRERPDLAEAFQRYDLFAATFHRNCLNRLQLTNNRMMVDLNAPEPVGSLQFVGMLANPISEQRSSAIEQAVSHVGG